MASLEEVRQSASAVGDSANKLQQRSSQLSADLKTHAAILAVIVAGSRSGEMAVMQARAASGAIDECTAAMARLQKAIDDFIATTREV